MLRSMLKPCLALALVALLAVSVPAVAKELVPLKGTFSGQTIGAVPTDDPDVLLVTTGGGGNATHLGRYTFVSPHFANLATGEAEGVQIFTAANGDTLTADFSGQFLPIEGGFLAAELLATITGGTGRFQGATGSYTFDIVFDPATFQSTAVINGVLSKPGAH